MLVGPLEVNLKRCSSSKPDNTVSDSGILILYCLQIDNKCLHNQKHTIKIWSMWRENIIKENIKGSNDQFSIKVGVHSH